MLWKVGGHFFIADFNTIIAIFMAKSSPKKPQIRQFWLLVELVALNGWIWVGYIQDGLLVPFGPSVIAIRGSWGARIGLKMP